MTLQASPSTRNIICLMLFCFLLALSPGLKGFVWDMLYWTHWSQWNAEHGMRNAYGSGTNYTPLYLYALWIFGKVMRTPEAIAHYINYVRFFTLIAEFWGLWFVWRWLDKKVEYLLILLISVFNLGYIYNTLIWGQVDAISAALIFTALYYLFRGKMWWSGAVLVLAVNMKLQTVIFIPLWGLLVISHLAQTRRWRDIPLTLIAMAVMQALIVLPLAFGQAGVKPAWDNAMGLVGSQSLVSRNAHNMWYWIMPYTGGELQTDDKEIFFAGLTYRQTGLLAFCLASLAAFIPLLRAVWKQVLRRNSAPPSRTVIWVTAALIALVFFFCNTEMHERYSHPAGIFLTAYAFYTRRWWTYILFSIAYFLNLEDVCHWLDLPNYGTLIFDQRLIAGLFAVLILGLYYTLYKLPVSGNIKESALAAEQAKSVQNAV